MRLAEHAQLVGWFATEHGKVVSYSIVLLTLHEGRWQTVRVCDNAHGENEMQRHTLSAGKHRAEAVRAGGEFGEAMRAARDEALARYEKMIEAWRH